jgi:aspartyl-tRNA(Asn)/glutamyl-tRNA(Gln) amidotransferase subunit A
VSDTTSISSAPADSTDLWSLTALELREAYRSRSLSPVEVTDAVLEHIELVNPTITAFITVTPDMARRQAREAERAYAGSPDDVGPLLGIPVSVKDLIPTKGIRTTFGSLVFENNVPLEDAPVVERLYAAGAVLLGKTATSEFGWKAPPSGRLFGSTRNPWGLELTTAGSSGGAAAAVACGLGPLAVGTDGGGSNRQPASFCGIVGLKPSSGRIATVPRSLAGDLEHYGTLARTVRDATLLLDALVGEDSRDWYSLPAEPGSYLGTIEESIAGARVAWSANLGYVSCDPEVVEIAESAARRFEELGCSVENAHPAWSDPVDMFDALFFDLWGATLAERLPEWEDLLDPGLVALARRSGRGTALDVARALEERIAFRQEAASFFEEFDLLLTPTMPLLPFPLGIDVPDTVAGQPVRSMQWTALTYPFNLTGNPAISVPAGWSRSGLPVGLQIAGGFRKDRLVLQAAAAFEDLAGWHDRWPPTVSPAG